MSIQSKEVLNNFLRAINHKQPERIPVVLCISTPYICELFGVKYEDYYFNSELKLKVQCAFQDKYPEMILIPGIYPDFGCGVVEPSAFGCQVIQKDNPLHPAVGSKDLHDIIHLKPPDPDKDGLMPLVLKEYRYYWDNLDKKYIENYGYLDGCAFSMGPVETAALVIGHESFLSGLYDHPGLIHQLLNIMSDFIIIWLKAQERVNGRLKRIYFFDHTPARLSSPHFEEFVFPYLSRVFNEFSYAIKLFHICEKNISHNLKRIGDLGIDALHFATDISEVKKTIGDKVCLMGNLNPITLLSKGTPQQVFKECKRCISIADNYNGGYILSPSGALIPGTSRENIQAVIDSTKYTDFVSVNKE